MELTATRRPSGIRIAARPPSHDGPSHPRSVRHSVAMCGAWLTLSPHLSDLAATTIRRRILALGGRVTGTIGDVMGRDVQGFDGKIGFIWSVADLLRGDYKAHEYGQVILPFTVLRRLDCVLEPTKDAVTQRALALAGKIQNVEPLLLKAAGQPFYNVSPLSFARLLDDANNVAANLRTYIQGFSSGAVEVLDKYGFDNTITRLDNAGILFQVVAAF